MNLQQITSDPRAIQLGMWFSQHAPERVGHRLSWWMSELVCRIKPAVYQIVQANLGQVLGPDVESQTLEQTVRQVFYTAVRSYFDLFRALQVSREELEAMIDFPEQARAVTRSLWNRKGGSILVFPHLGSFDIAALALGTYLPEPQVLTLPDPPPGYELTNKLRQRTGVEITPLSATALRQAIQRLRRGGLISVAGDRPVSELDQPVPFFGRPARVPSGHIRLALKTNALVLVGCCFLSPDTGRYTVHIEPPLEMLRTGDREEELQVNMRRVLDVMEAVIRRWAWQWQMFVPVWPEPLEP
jgi:KDO2-lipid IV(A) lauroyltransferase